MSLILIRYVLRAAIRDKILISLVLAFLVGSSLAVFMGSSAVIEKQQFAVVFAGGGLRIVGVLGLALFVIFHVRRSFESRDVEFLLSRPISRARFLFSFAAAFSILAVLAGLMEGACMYILAPQIFGRGAVLWAVSVAAENVIMVNTAFFFAMILSSAVTGAMATCGFYVLGRMMGELLGIINSDTEFRWFAWLTGVMKMISAVTPRLDLMGQTSWLVYGPDTSVGYGFVMAQGAAFTALVLIASLIDLSRRKF